MTTLRVEPGVQKQLRRQPPGTFYVLCTALVATLGLAWGCAGLASGKSSNTPSLPGTYGVSGTITPAANGSGATVSLSGVTSATTTANSSGTYAFSGLANGTYVVSPSRTGYSFSPGTQSVTVSGANVSGIDFTATVGPPPSTHTVSLNWSASPTATVTGYNVYRSTVNGSLYTRVNIAQVTGLAYTDTTVQNGTTYYFVATAVDANGSESIYSNQVPAVIP